MIKLFFLKIKYLINRFYFFILNLSLVKILLRRIHPLREYFFLIRYTISEDKYRSQLKIVQWKENFWNFKFFKYIYLFFLLITGVIPLLIFLYLIFVFLKYFFKYLWLTLDHFFPFFNNSNIYLGLKKIYSYLFLQIPDSLLGIYRYFFGGGWIKFFLAKFKNYWKNKWLRFLSSFFSVTDEIILVKSPDLYTRLKEKILDLYYLLVKLFFKMQRKFKDFFKFFRNIFRKILRRIRRKYRRVRRVYDQWFRKYYYRWYFWYIRTYIYYAWIFKKYIWSDIFVVTIEAFTFIAFWNTVACVKYSLALFYTRLQYIFSEIFFALWTKLIYLEFHLHNFLEYLIYQWRILRINLKFFLIELRYLIHFNINMVSLQLIYASPYLWYWWKHECYEVDKGYISLMWSGLKFYAIIQRFFRRLYPLPWRLFFFNGKIQHLAFVITYGYLLRILSRRFLEGCYYMFYLKFIYFI